MADKPKIPQELTKGPANAVPCPWCGRPNDMTQLSDLGGLGEEVGAEIGCDHCHRISKVARVQTVKVFFLKPIARAKGFR